MNPLNFGQQRLYKLSERFIPNPKLIIVNGPVPSFVVLTRVLSAFRERVLEKQWIGERLEMAHYTRVTQAVSRMNRKPARKLRSMRETLLKLDT